jgi:hypothetical protein
MNDGTAAENGSAQAEFGIKIDGPADMPEELKALIGGPAGITVMGIAQFAQHHEEVEEELGQAVAIIHYLMNQIPGRTVTIPESWFSTPPDPADKLRATANDDRSLTIRFMTGEEAAAQERERG